MAVTISDNYQVKYTRKWGTLLQQHASRLDKYVSVMRDLSGKVVFLDQFGILDFTEKTTRVGQTVLNEAPTTRRSMRPRTFTKAIGFIVVANILKRDFLWHLINYRLQSISI